MDLSDAPEDARFRGEVAAWLADTLPTLPWPEPADLVERLPFWQKWQQTVFDAGYAGPSWPAQYGGGGNGRPAPGDPDRGDGSRRGPRPTQHDR